MTDVTMHGDPHGNWEPLLRAGRDDRPEGALILGDCDLAMPVPHQAAIGIDRVARACRVRLVVHGHHHGSHDGRLPDGTRVRGLAIAEVFRVGPEFLA